jgi:phospholipase C
VRDGTYLALRYPVLAAALLVYILARMVATGGHAVAPLLQVHRLPATMPRGLDKIDHCIFLITDHCGFPITDRHAFIITDRRTFIVADHLSFIITENHSVDNYVGRFPGADGATVVRTTTGAVVPLADAPAQVSPDLSHSMRHGSSTTPPTTSPRCCPWSRNG